MTPRHVLAGIAFALVSAAIVAGLVVVGSPSNERARRFDERRVGALRSLSSEVDGYWMARGRLPASLAELANNPRHGVETKDPETNEEYSYRVLSEKKYELCANFERESDEDVFSPFWKHGAGRQCFEIEAAALGK